AEVVKVGTGGVRQHDGASGIVDAGAQLQLPEGANLQQLDERLRLDLGVQLGRTFGQLRQHLAEDLLEVQRLDHIRRGHLGEVDGGELAHVMAPRRSGMRRLSGSWTSARLPSMSSTICPGCSPRNSCTRLSRMRGSQRSSAMAVAA